MKQVGIFEAKTHLSSLLDEVENGAEVTITRHGKPVARLVQATSELSADTIARRRQAIRNLRSLARDLKLNPPHDEIKSWINEGRR
ncbi:type II toxin-antitoxin system Phd/YefM family antitoxin [Rhodopseudomonas palustris]|uniref:type II toxin-antitoxin system Phd/YefM family antitoxin n=1 Tax=Rhodopseudomonas palustris TaxID=1076 RepID=UPI000D19A3E8|nr:type II toxin-antitoxin system prevent-host-death family antitoxin [Rhodopseudomonas palustris]AVT80691.1 prevent-host-death protein [Rhodopseudomonas palustris]